MAGIAAKHPNIPENLWNLLPQFLSEPRFVFPHREDTHSVVLIGKLSSGSNVIVGVRADGEILRITPWESAVGETSGERVARARHRTVAAGYGLCGDEERP